MSQHSRITRFAWMAAQLDERGLRFLRVDPVLARANGLRIAESDLYALGWRLLPKELCVRLRARVAGGPAEAAP